MGFKVNIEGPETILLGKDVVKNVQANIATPSDSRARSTKDLANLTITGKLYTIEGGESTDTIKLFEWSQTPAEKVDEAYRNVTVEIEANGKIFRKLQYPNAFVIDYTERYDDTTGYGEFTLILRQKTDKTADVKAEGDLPGGEAGGGSEAGGGQAGAATAATGGAAPAASAAPQSMKTPSAMNAATTGGIAGGAAAGSIAKTMQNAAKAAVSQVAQQALQKADPSGAAAAAATSLTQAAQNPEAFAQQTMKTATAQETAKLMQKAKQPDMANMIKGL